MRAALVVATLFGACAARSLPRWTAPRPDETKPLGGFSMADGVEPIPVYMADPQFGTYNHAAMLDYHQGRFILAWKNGPSTEDKAGQRILFSQSSDGLNWTKTDGTNVLFPDMTTTSRPAAMFVGPFAHLRGRLYAAASPGQPTGAARGAQFCLWPDPLDLPSSDGGKRNCGPPGSPQAKDTLLLRRVLPGPLHSLGPIFWAAPTVPEAWAEASAALGFRTLSEMDAETRGDVAEMGPNALTPPCASQSEGSLKCEACAGGCQIWDDIPASTQPIISNERAHYVVTTDNALQDVILYRTGNPGTGNLYASLRHGTGQHDWSPPVETDIPNDESNINAGPLPDGSIYLVSNPVFRSKDGEANTLRFRDPVTVAVARDGLNFSTVKVVMSCTELSKTSSCAPRFAGGGKNPGPSYPQGLAVTAPAPYAVQGFYVVATNNKEDVWLAKVPFKSLRELQDSHHRTPLTAQPTFDGILRPSKEDPERADAFLTPPACPHGVKECQESSNHCASLEVLPDDSLVLAWFSGYREGWDQTGIAVSHLPRHAAGSTERWAPPSLVTRAEGFSTQNPVLFFENNTMWLFYVRQPSRSSADQAGRLSDDPVPSQETMGQMWVSSAAIDTERAPRIDSVQTTRSQPLELSWGEARLFQAANGTWGRNSIIRQLDGSWLMPVYNESLKSAGHQLEYSMLFRKPAASPVLPFKGSWSTLPFPASGFLVQPSVVRLRAGQPQLRAFFRDRRAVWIYTSVSEDDGVTWTSPTATGLPNNNAGIHATALKSGALAIVYNNMAGQTKKNLRNHLAVSLSDDGGETWSFTRHLEDHANMTVMSSTSPVAGVGPTSCNCYSYPTMTQTRDEWIHIAYTWQRRTIKYTRISEQWIRSTTSAVWI